MTEEAANPHLSPDQVDFDAVGKVSSRVTLATIRSRHASATLNAEPDEIPADWAKKAFIGFDSHALDLDFEVEQLRVITSFIALFVPGHDATDSEEFPSPEEVDAAIEITTTYEMLYDVEDVDGITEVEAEHFAFANATMHAWPYWREFAHSACGRMSVPPLLVGMFRIPALRDLPSPDRK